MILQALKEYYERLAEEGKVSTPGWCQAKVSYAIELRADGDIKAIFDLREEKGEGKRKRWEPKALRVPEMVTRSSGISANFLCDNAKYLLGIDADSEDQRVQDCFQAAKKKHLEILNGVDSVMARAVCAYFKKWDPQKAKENPTVLEKWEELTAGGNLVFSMGIQYAQDDVAIQRAWEVQDDGESEEKGLCLVTGEKAPIARIHRTIKGVPGAQSSGAALVSFNAPAFESYGKAQSYNAPVGKYAEYAYTTALNYLLSNRAYTEQIGDTMIVCWAESAREEYPAAFWDAIDPPKDNQEDVIAVFHSIENDGYINYKEVELDPRQKFYIMGIAPNAARLAIRFFYENSFGNILKNIIAHYDRMEMVKPAWEKREYLGIEDMLDQTVNQKSRDKKPVSNMSVAVLKAIVSGSRYPASLYTNTIMRIRAEQGNITWGRAAIDKAYLIRNYHWKEGEAYMECREESQEVAYVLGRLFAILEFIQRRASGDIKATIRDRYFNAACAAPASVFPVLLKLKNSHLRKIERDSVGAKIHYEQKVTELMCKFSEFPKRLSLEDQGKFNIGYYHQMQKNYEKKEEK